MSISTKSVSSAPITSVLEPPLPASIVRVLEAVNFWLAPDEFGTKITILLSAVFVGTGILRAEKPVDTDWIWTAFVSGVLSPNLIL